MNMSAVDTSVLSDRDHVSDRAGLAIGGLSELMVESRGTLSVLVQVDACGVHVTIVLVCTCVLRTYSYVPGIIVICGYLGKWQSCVLNELLHLTVVGKLISARGSTSTILRRQLFTSTMLTAVSL